MKYSITDLLSIYLPKNIRKTRDNLSDFQGRVAPYANSIRLYDVIKDTVEYLNISPSNTDLSLTTTATNVTVNSSNGTDATIAAATTSTAGVMSATDKTNLSALITLSGVSAGQTHLGTFSGSIIPDNTTIKAALQSLETSISGISYTLGNLSSSTSAITVVGGSNAVIGSGVTLTLNPSNISLSNLGGSLNLSQLSTAEATNGQVIMFNGTNYQPTTLASITTHNSLSSIQGGTTGQYYHLTLSGYNAVENFPQLSLAGRDATGTGLLQAITLSHSLTFSGTNSISLVNDSTSPGNSYYYGTNSSGTKGFFTLPSTVTQVTTSDSSDIDFTTTNPTTTPLITASLTTTGVTASSYGSPSQVATFSVDSKGRITTATSTSISIMASQVTNLTETTQDMLATFLQAGSGVTLTYNDSLNTLTIDATTPNEVIDDRVASLLQAGSGITLTYNDPSNTLTISATGTGYSTVQDDGTPYTQRTALNFKGYGLLVNDDNVNLRTEVQLNTNLQLYASLTGIGMIAKDAQGVAYEVEIEGGTGINVASGLGVLGNPTISLNHLGIENLVDPNADKIMFWDDSVSRMQWLTLGTNLSITGTTLNAAGGTGTLPPTADTGDFLFFDGTNWTQITPVRNTQINNTGNIVTLPSTPLANTPLTLYINGLLKEPVEDYTVSGATVTLAMNLVITDKVTTIYYTT